MQRETPALGADELACLRQLHRDGDANLSHCSSAVLEHLVALGLVAHEEGVGLPGFAAGSRYRLTVAGRRLLESH